MQKVNLGSTGLLVSRMGLGTVKFGRNTDVKYPSSFDLPSDREIIELMAFAQDLGINLLDTAPAYGMSETRIGNLLDNRQDWILVTKVGEEYDGRTSEYIYTPKHIRMSVERSLKRLKTDYLDLVLLHSDGNDVYNIQEFGVFDTLHSLKQEGLLRSIGMSTKTIEGGMLTVDHADVVMLTHNLAYTDEQPVIAYAHKHNKGVLIKKGLASGHITQLPTNLDPITASMQFIFKEPGVSSVIIGTLNQSHLAQNIQALQEF